MIGFEDSSDHYAQMCRLGSSNFLSKKDTRAFFVVHGLICFDAIDLGLNIGTDFTGFLHFGG